MVPSHGNSAGVWGKIVRELPAVSEGDTLPRGDTHINPLWVGICQMSILCHFQGRIERIKAEEVGINPVTINDERASRFRCLLIRL